MREQNNITNEYEEIWDTGTYQTGASKPKKGQSVLIMVLMVSVIFLGGLASALGLMNIRLLRQLVQQQNAVLPVSVDSATEGADSFLRENQSGIPLLPSQREIVFTVAEKAARLTEAEILEKMSSSVLTITAQLSQNKQQMGPALVLSSDGYLLTNAHLIENARSITVLLPDGQETRGIVVAVDAYADLAVLYVAFQGLTPAEFAPEQQLPSGEEAIYTSLHHDSLSAGEIFSQSLTLEVGGGDIVLRETDLSTDHGPVYDDYGRVVGFLSRYFGTTDSGFLLSAQQVMDIAGQLVEKGSVSGRPSLGLEVAQLPSFYRQYWKLEQGLEIVELLQENEILLEGDIILSINGTPLEGLQPYFAVLLAAREGQMMELEVFRAGQKFVMQLPVGQIP